MTSSDFKQGYVRLRQEVEMTAHEVRHQHTLCCTFNKDRSIREEQIGMGGAQIARVEALGFLVCAEHC